VIARAGASIASGGPGCLALSALEACRAETWTPNHPTAKRNLEIQNACKVRQQVFGFTKPDLPDFTNNFGMHGRAFAVAPYNVIHFGEDFSVKLSHLR
jgi:hypothetical protein